MRLGNFPKQPIDVLDYDIDYSQWLTVGDNVQSATVVVEPNDLILDATFINDPRIKIWLAGGTHLTTYKVTVTMTTADGRIKQDEFRVKVKDN